MVIDTQQLQHAKHSQDVWEYDSPTGERPSSVLEPFRQEYNSCDKESFDKSKEYLNIALFLHEGFVF